MGKAIGVLVLGVGNIIMRDEGAGVEVVRRLPLRYELPKEVRCLDGGTAGIALVDRIMSARRLIVVDVVSTGDAAGSVVRFTPNQVASTTRFLSSAHQIGIPELLAIAEFEGRAPKTVIVGIVPEDISPGEGLTETTESAVERAVERVAAELASMGLEIKERNADA